MKQYPAKPLCGALCVAVARAIAFTPLASSQADDDSSSIFGVRIPTGYRQWELIARSHEAGDFNELRVILGNATATTAYREGTLPFPDGAILVKLAWKREPSLEFPGAFVPGHATTVQIMVKDPKRYASMAAGASAADEVHNLIVCTLCSCYPRPALGLPPDWYKLKPYRSRVVSEPRIVLAEFGTIIPDDVEIRVSDATAMVRYLVLPKRPEGTADYTEDALAELVTHDAMIRAIPVTIDNGRTA
ncbi:MAG: nitrile hydratase subunit alpha [Methylobacteriaceae bacterium]|nr:nitrile hydratase subunit alpha [Methylobacteriaceae bacterium]